MRRSGGRHVRLLAALAVVAVLVGVGSGVRSDAGEGPADPGGGASRRSNPATAFNA